MIIAAALSATLFYLMQTKKLVAKQSMKNDADADVEKALGIINEILINPNHCNSNFFGMAIPATSSTQVTTAFTFKHCNGSCSGGAGASTNVLNYGTYNMFDPSKPARARIISFKYKVSRQTTGASRAPGILTMDIMFEKDVGYKTVGGTVSKVYANTKTYTLQAYVITGTFDFSTNTLSASGTILGCAKNSASTVAY